MEQTDKKAIGVGLFILIGLLFLIAGVLTVGNLRSTFSEKLNVSSVFNEVNGLQAGNNIWFSGVKIGTVKQVEFYGTSQVKVVMNIKIDSKQYIRKDAKVKISTDGFIGNKILVIYGGTSDTPEIEDGDILHNESILSTDDIINTLQQNNINILKITKELAQGEGTIGKLLSNDDIYKDMSSAIKSLQAASANAQVLMASLENFSEKLNNKGGLTNDILTDTTVFKSLKASVLQLHQVIDTANIFVSNIKQAASNPKNAVGVLLHDEQTGTSLKTTILNLQSSSEKLDKNLEAIQHNFLLRGYFKKEAKKEAKKKNN